MGFSGEIGFNVLGPEVRPSGETIVARVFCDAL